MFQFSLQQHHESLFPPPSPMSDERLSEATLALLAYEAWQNEQKSGEQGDYCHFTHTVQWVLCLILTPLGQS